MSYQKLYDSPKAMSTPEIQSKLIEWFQANQRELPWRRQRDPYRIWISETMLQQTTTTAVIPYFERFVARFPTLAALAKSEEGDVLENWAGLGYYSRARNLHKAARVLHAKTEFPRSHTELLELPGLGPYTARAVASLAFDEPVGVVDGNVIRVLSRFEGEDWEWWKPGARDEIQRRADAWVRGVSPYLMNQGLMELGRTICTPKSPSCLLCPLAPMCASRRDDCVEARPKPRPRKEREIWHWEPHIIIERERLLLRQNGDLPFLRGQWLPPGRARRKTAKPRAYDYRHSVTHHDIFVTVKLETLKMQKNDKWVRLKEIDRHVPASLVKKALEAATVAGSAARSKRLPASATRKNSARARRT